MQIFLRVKVAMVVAVATTEKGGCCGGSEESTLLMGCDWRSEVGRDKVVISFVLKIIY